MLGEPGLLLEARKLVGEHRRGEGSSHRLAELTAIRSRLRSMAAHPATSAGMRERVLGVLLIVDVLVRSAPVGAGQRSAG